jgi:hypothetical protein
MGAPLASLQALESSRGGENASVLLDKWRDSVDKSEQVFSASVAYLSTGKPEGFTKDECWFLLALLAEAVDDEELGPACEALEARLEEEAAKWPGDHDDEPDDSKLRELSPVYLTMSDAWSSLRLAIEVNFFSTIGLADAARALVSDGNEWERALRDGEATLLGVPRIVLTADDDPFGILMK